jgi:hydroxymethylpyrimidine pyrophosphatase-like HAD family hydrolase
MIVFFDLDGTLISDDGAYIIPESAINAIHKAQANGHLMYVDTGRTIMNIEQRLLDIGFDGYICGCGMYIECGKEVIFQHFRHPIVRDYTDFLRINRILNRLPVNL